MTFCHGVDLLFCNEAEAAILADEFAELDALPEILLATSGVKSQASSPRAMQAFPPGTGEESSGVCQPHRLRSPHPMAQAIA